MTQFGVYGALHVSLDNNIAEAEIRRPPNNFFDLDLIDGLVAAFRDLDQEDNCRAIVLCAEGKNFCAGAQFHNDGTRGGEITAKNPDGSPAIFTMPRLIFSAAKHQLSQPSKVRPWEAA